MKRERRVRIFDTDAVGVIFFGSQLRFFQEATEELLEEMGCSLRSLLLLSSSHLVVVHAEADYLTPILLGDLLEIRGSLKRLGSTSLTLSFELFRGEVLVGQGEIVYVTIDAASRKKRTLPAPLREALLGYFSPQTKGEPR